MKKLDLKEMKDKCHELASILKTMANPQRLAIFCLLTDGEKSVGELTEICEISQPVISQHLNRMRLQGFIDFRKEKNFVYYYIVDEKVKKTLDALCDIYSN